MSVSRDMRVIPVSAVDSHTALGPVFLSLGPRLLIALVHKLTALVSSGTGDMTR